jgi:hypothetical protein
MPRFFRTFGSKQVTVIRNEGTDSEQSLNSKHMCNWGRPSSRSTLRSTRATSSRFLIRLSGSMRRVVQRIDVLDHGPRDVIKRSAR